MTEAIIESSGNVFLDLGIPPEEAELLARQAKLLNELRKLFWMQVGLMKKLLSIYRLAKLELTN